jgi:transmembrane sensor
MTRPSDLVGRIGRVAEAIDPALTERDVQRLVAGAGRRARRRARRRLALGGVGLGAAALLLALRFSGPAPAPIAIAPRPAPPAPPAPDRAGAPRLEAPRLEPLRLDDGSVATPLDAGTALALRESAPQRVTIELSHGRGRFEVTPRPERQFVVRAGDVTVTVLGTAFTVERVADRIGVAVERGKVMVDWQVGSRRLVAGESGWFPPLMVGASAPAPEVRTHPASRAAIASRPGPAPVVPRQEAAPSTDPPELVEPVGEQPAPVSRYVSPPAAPAARAEAPAGDADDQTARETAASLLAAADAARLDGRPADGAALLRRVLREHRNDPRAPLAAFTLGRVLLKELDRPRQAAAAFAEARALAPRGPFAEDALAREAEAWQAAGETGEAASRAQDYLRRYPNGRRAAAMRAVGGE